MTSIQGYGRSCKEHSSIALSDSFSLLELDNKLSNQPVGPSRQDFAVVPAVIPFVPKHNQEDLQKILKTVLEAQALTTSEKSRDKPLKTCSSNVFYGKSHIKCYNFCQ